MMLSLPPFHSSSSLSLSLLLIINWTSAVPVNDDYPEYSVKDFASPPYLKNDVVTIDELPPQPRVATHQVRILYNPKNSQQTYPDYPRVPARSPSRSPDRVSTPGRQYPPARKASVMFHQCYVNPVSCF